MDNVRVLLENNLYTVVSITCVALFISIVWNIILSAQFAALNKRYKKFMRGTSGKNIESMILENIENLRSNDEKFDVLNTNFTLMQEQLDKCIQRHSIVRYNAFNDTGSDLSYSIALMDNFDNGVTITGIYGRNEFIGYAKPVEGGNSPYPLSIEEQMAISRCQKKRLNKKT